MLSEAVEAVKEADKMGTRIEWLDKVRKDSEGKRTSEVCSKNDCYKGTHGGLAETTRRSRRRIGGSRK